MPSCMYYILYYPGVICFIYSIYISLYLAVNICMFLKPVAIY